MYRRGGDVQNIFHFNGDRCLFIILVCAVRLCTEHRNDFEVFYLLKQFSL